MHLYHENMLNKIGSGIGHVIKIDNNTKETSRGKYARIVVVVDLRKPLVLKVNNKNHVQIVNTKIYPIYAFYVGVLAIATLNAVSLRARTLRSVNPFRRKR